MSITKIDDPSALLALAQEFDIDLNNSGPSLLTGGTTKFSLPKGIRFCVGYFDTGTFSWNAEGQTKEFGEEFYRKAGDELVPLTGFNEIGGCIVSFEVQPRLSHYKDGATETFCSVIGTECLSDDGKEQVVKALPSTPLKGMYGWKDNAMDYNTPDGLVAKMGMVGSRGQRCVDCIKSGNSIMPIEKEDGTVIKESCNVRGVLYIYVTEMSLISKKAVGKGKPPEESRKTYTMEELCDESGNPLKPFILAVNITSLGLRGAWKDEPQIIGYFHYIRSLEKAYGNDPRRMPYFWHTTISIRKKTDGIKFQLHFDKRAQDLNVTRAALNLWNSMKPSSIEVVPASEVINDDTVLVPNDVDYDNLRTTSMVDEDNFSFDV
jgi:hypothetical protein